VDGDGDGGGTGAVAIRAMQSSPFAGVVPGGHFGVPMQRAFAVDHACSGQQQ